MAKGVKTGGRVAGTPNKVTADFKESVSGLLQSCSPQMPEWIGRVAATDPAKALDLLGRLAEYVFPKLSRAENQITGKNGGPVQLNATVNFVKPND